MKLHRKSGGVILDAADMRKLLPMLVGGLDGLVSDTTRAARKYTNAVDKAGEASQSAQSAKRQFQGAERRLSDGKIIVAGLTAHGRRGAVARTSKPRK